MRYFLKIFVVFSSLLATPVILFVSSVRELYIKNQMDLGYSYQVLYPFVLPFALTVLAGVVLYIFSSRRPIRHMLRVYYALGPFFILYAPLQNLPVPFVQTLVGFTVVLVLFLVFFFLITGRIKDSHVVSFFAFAGLFFLFSEGYFFYTGLKPAPSYNTGASFRQADNQGGAKKLPNIYMVLLDGYQTDMFDATVTTRVNKTLRGFIQFHENTALFGRTNMSIPSIFGGKSYGFNGPQVDYKDSSFSSSSSVLFWLKQAGYSEYAYVMDQIAGYNNLALFDKVTVHESRQGRYTPYTAFFGAWVSRNLPLFAARSILGDRRLKHIKSINSLPKNASISSYNGFLRYLEEEKDLPGANRFTFAYMLNPHPPFVFNDDCSFANDMTATGPIHQARCATSLIVKFVQRLKELGRFKDSMIIITADHGLHFRRQAGKLEPIEGGLDLQRAHSRGLLMIKPAGVDETEPLRISRFQSSLLDIAPTIASTLPIAPPVVFEGVSLINPTPPVTARKKYYYFFDKKGIAGWTDEMYRYVIEDNTIRQDGIVKIENNGPPITRYMQMPERAKTVRLKNSSEDELKAAVESNPNNAAPYLNLTAFYVKRQDYKRAKAMMQKAVMLEPGDYRMKLRLAVLKARSGDLRGAEQGFETVLKKFPGWDSALSGLGNVYFLQNRFDLAFKYFQRAIEINPAQPSALYNAALSLDNLGRIKQAAEYYQRFVSLAPQGLEGAVERASQRLQSIQGSR